MPSQNPSQKINAIVLFGGKSAEHEISLMSAKNIVNAMSPNKYNITLIGITPSGAWKYLSDAKALLDSGKLTRFSDDTPNTKPVFIIPGLDKAPFLVDGQPIPTDVVIPVLHGPFGEDGTVQGLLKLLNVPYVGPDILGSSLSMDKDAMKKNLRDSKIPVSNWVLIKKENLRHALQEESKIQKDNLGPQTYEEVSKLLGKTLFVKPSNMGSSIGVHKVTNKEEYNKALRDAFLYDNRVLIEEEIKGREIECSILGNEDPKASLPGEIIVKSKDGFYSYDAKYVDDQGSETKIPADLTQEQIKTIQELALKTFKSLYLEGLSRVDMFVCPDNKIYINEVNTIPGFTNISMYPKMWEATGIKYSELIDQIINLGIQRFQRDQKLRILKD